MSRGSAPSGERLPDVGGFDFLEGVAGELLLRPWFDWVALRAVAHGYFPLSRGWAAALASGRSLERFFEALPGQFRHAALFARALRQVDKRRAIYESAYRTWLDCFFGPGESPPHRLVAAELARHRAAHRLMAARAAFLPLIGSLPAVRWQVARPEQVEDRHGPRLSGSAAAYPAPRETAVAQSRPIDGPGGPECWLRFASPAMNDMAWARVASPRAVKNPATLIFLHGIAMENDMWRGAADVLAHGAVPGLRVVRPEGPWHGRRRLDGWYGGEPALGRGPLGFLELFQAWVEEVAVLIHWARRTSTGPVALGGVSLGALAAQLAAAAAAHWPDEMRPDALFLVATGGQMLELAEHGSLARALGLQRQIAAQGWTREALARWLPLLEPAGPPSMAPERVVMVIGERDDLTPYAGGLALARFWKLPAANLFTRRRGHFSVSLGLMRDQAPLRRLGEILGADP